MPSRSTGFIRPHHPKFAMFHRLLDSAIVVFALVFAATAYDGTMKDAYWLAGLLAVLGLQVAGEITQIYASWRVYTLRQEVSELALACLVVGALLVTGAFVSKTSEQYSRVVMVLWWTLAYSGLAVERFVIRALLRASRAHGRNTRSLAIGDWRSRWRIEFSGRRGLRRSGISTTLFSSNKSCGSNSV